MLLPSMFSETRFVLFVTTDYMIGKESFWSTGRMREGLFFLNNTLLTIKHTEHYINWLQGNIA